MLAIPGTPSWTTGDDYNDMADLLGLIAATDHRSISASDIRLWLEIARDGDWPSIAFARRAVIRFRNDHPGVWLEPGHITQTLRQVRASAGQCYYEPQPPREVLEGPQQAYRDFLNNARVQHVAAYIGAWTEGHRRDSDIKAAMGLLTPAALEAYKASSR